MEAFKMSLATESSSNNFGNDSEASKSIKGTNFSLYTMPQCIQVYIHSILFTCFQTNRALNLTTGQC
jgi:hypothetical protein